jgi:hypothetical protein
VPYYLALDDISVTPLLAPTLAGVAATANQVSLTWNALAGLGYQVQYTTDLVNPNWINLGSAMTASSNTLTLSDTNSVAIAPERFYRLLLVP